MAVNNNQWLGVVSMYRPGDPIDGSVCVDCLMMIANGDSSGIGNLREWELRVEALDPTDGGAYRVELVGDSTYFSRSRCDYCGSTLGGDRHDVVFIDTRHYNK